MGHTGPSAIARLLEDITQTVHIAKSLTRHFPENLAMSLIGCRDAFQRRKPGSPGFLGTKS
jgi:hypothetical protein